MVNANCKNQTAFKYLFADFSVNEGERGGTPKIRKMISTKKLQEWRGGTTYSAKKNPQEKGIFGPKHYF